MDKCTAMEKELPAPPPPGVPPVPPPISFLGGLHKAPPPHEPFPLWKTAIASLLGIGLAYAVTVVALRLPSERVAALDQRIRELQQTIGQSPSGDSERLGRRARAVKDVLAQEHLVSPLFGLLEEHISADTAFTTFTIDLERGIRIEAVSRDFVAASKQIVALKQIPEFRTVETTTIEGIFDDRDRLLGVRYSLRIILSP